MSRNHIGNLVMKSTRILVLLLLSLLLASEAVSAKLILTAPPRENPDTGKKYYEPIAKALSKLIGQEVVYKHPRNWTYYAKDMRSGKYDIVFDGPHFASWRIKHVGHTAVARLPGNLHFYILVNKNDKKLRTMKDLLGKAFCGLPSPNLGTMSAFDLYKNPIVQPDIKIIKGGMRKTMRQFLEGKCRAAVVRDKLYKKLSKEQKSKIRILAKSRKMPNQSITVSSKINKANQAKIAAYLTSKKGAKSAGKLFARFSKKKKYFIKSNSKEYAGLNDLLEGVVYGW